MSYEIPDNSKSSHEKKIIVLDTSVLLEDAHAIEAFGAEEIGIPVVVLEELDHIKSEPTFRGRNAREAIRMFDALRAHGDLRTGVKIETGGILRVLVPDNKAIFSNRSTSHYGYIVDNEILKLAQAEQDKGFFVEIISKDINLRVKADILGMAARDYKADFIDERNMYKGWSILDVSPSQLKKDMPDDLREAHKQKPFILNEFIILESGNNQENKRLFRYIGNNQFKRVENIHLKWALKPRNIQQFMALNLLFDPNIRLATLVGPAGTGKTFLALVAALHEVLFYEAFEKVLVTRPIVPLGQDIGYLPGDIHEKLHTWMQPIYDNMDYILHSAQRAEQASGIYHEDPNHSDSGHDKHDKHDKYDKFKKKKHDHSVGGLPSLDELIARRRVSLEAITYMRGRSIPYQFIIIDEVQNLTPHEVKTLISRVGEGSKVVLTGDPYQIDAHHLDFSNNGLVVTADRFKGQSIFGTVFLETTERSELSRLAAQLL